MTPAQREALNKIRDLVLSHDARMCATSFVEGWDAAIATLLPVIEACEWYEDFVNYGNPAKQALERVFGATAKHAKVFGATDEKE